MPILSNCQNIDVDVVCMEILGKHFSEFNNLKKSNQSDLKNTYSDGSSLYSFNNKRVMYSAMFIGESWMGANENYTSIFEWYSLILMRFGKPDKDQPTDSGGKILTWTGATSFINVSVSSGGTTIIIQFYDKTLAKY